MRSNPSTGYSWTLTNTNAAQQYVQEVYSSYIQDSAPQGYVGVGGSVYKTYACASNGSVNLNFAYQRPWDSVPANTFSASVNVNDSNGLMDTYEIQEGSDLNASYSVGDSFIIKQRVSPSTGYSWVLNGASDIKSRNIVFNFQGQQIMDPKPLGFVGGGGYQYSTYTCLNSGTEVLEYMHKPPGANRVGNTGKMTITVTNLSASQSSSDPSSTPSSGSDSSTNSTLSSTQSSGSDSSANQSSSSNSSSNQSNGSDPATANPSNVAIVSTDQSNVSNSSNVAVNIQSNNQIDLSFSVPQSQKRFMKKNN